jgi:hypothetical protein
MDFLYAVSLQKGDIKEFEKLDRPNAFRHLTEPNLYIRVFDSEEEAKRYAEEFKHRNFRTKSSTPFIAKFTAQGINKVNCTSDEFKKLTRNGTEDFNDQFDEKYHERYAYTSNSWSLNELFFEYHCLEEVKRYFKLRNKDIDQNAVATYSQIINTNSPSIKTFKSCLLHRDELIPNNLIEVYPYDDENKKYSVPPRPNYIFMIKLLVHPVSEPVCVKLYLAGISLMIAGIVLNISGLFAISLALAAVGAATTIFVSISAITSGFFSQKRETPVELPNISLAVP